MKDDKHSSVERLLFPEIESESVQHVETLSDERAEKVVFETVDFANPNRPKTCLEVDFPILKVNEVAYKEALGPCTKPIYRASKWWARRRPSVFRQLLIAAATKSPAREESSAQLSWSLMYRKNHQKYGRFKGIKVLDIFMGGGTSVVEAARLGFSVTGVDLNPIAWWIVHNETNPVTSADLKGFEKYIESEVKPQIMPFFVAKSPRGFGGRWTHISTGKEISINPVEISWDERKQYRWDGPEVIYTFWLKHVMCSDPSCCHLTPQINSNIVAEKSMKVKSWLDCICPNSKCGQIFDLEETDFRMAPSVDFVLGNDERPFASINLNKEGSCPYCKKILTKEWIVETTTRKGKATSKQVNHSLLIDKGWASGITAPKKSAFGGYYGASKEQDKLWFTLRSEGLRLQEVRGKIPENILHSNFSQKKQDGSEEEKSSGNLICGKCGRSQDPLSSIKLTGHMASEFPYMIQGFDPEAKSRKLPYSGRFYDLPNVNLVLGAIVEFCKRDDLVDWVPNLEIPIGCETHQRKNLPGHGYTHWHKMFNPRQLYTNSLILKTIDEAPEKIVTSIVKSHTLGAFQNYIRHNCSFTIWDFGMDLLQPQFANNNYHPKSNSVENVPFSSEARGSFTRMMATSVEASEFWENPFDYRIENGETSSKAIKEPSLDGIGTNSPNLICASSTNLSKYIGDKSIDLVITDPPFGDNLNYAEFADFFLVWLKKPLARIFPDVFQSQESPKRLEAVANRIRFPGKSGDGRFNSDIEYDRLLTLCWKEAHRVLKDGGILAFTFHHDKDVAWIGVLESLFKGGFIIEGAFPVRSDSTKGEGKGAFGSKKIEFDIVHVCRKRLNESIDIYWATLRKKIIESVGSRRLLLEQHFRDGLGLADLEVIIRGEVLEQFSKHYGKVKKNLAGDLMSVKEILIEAGDIARNLLTRDKADRLPDSIGPETRVYFWLFRDGPAVEFNQAKLKLKGYGISVEDLAANDWLKIERQDGKKIVRLFEPVDRWNSLARKKSLKSDLDQVHFAINCFVERRTNSDDRTDLEKWVVENIESLYPSVVPILQYMEKTHFGSAYQLQLAPALRAIERGLAKAKQGKQEIKGLFD